MGLCDYMLDSTIKCFTIGIVFDCEKYGYNGDVCFSKLAGSLSNYEIGSIVPYKSYTYNYSKDFYILDLSIYNDTLYIFKILNGKLEGVEKLEYVDFSKLIIDENGRELKLNSIEDIKNCVEDYKFYNEKFRQLAKENRKLINSSKINSTEKISPLQNEKLIELYSKNLNKIIANTIDIFEKRWITLSNNINSNNIGYFIEELKSNPSEESYIEIHRLLEKYKCSNKDFLKELEEYKDWASEIISIEEIDKILRIT